MFWENNEREREKETGEGEEIGLGQNKGAVSFMPNIYF